MAPSWHERHRPPPPTPARPLHAGCHPPHPLPPPWLQAALRSKHDVTRKVTRVSVSSPPSAPCPPPSPPAVARVSCPVLSDKRCAADAKADGSMVGCLLECSWAACRTAYGQRLHCCKSCLLRILKQPGPEGSSRPPLQQPAPLQHPTVPAQKGGSARDRQAKPATKLFALFFQPTRFCLTMI